MSEAKTGVSKGNTNQERDQSDKSEEEIIVLKKNTLGGKMKTLAYKKESELEVSEPEEVLKRNTLGGKMKTLAYKKESDLEVFEPEEVLKKNTLGGKMKTLAYKHEDQPDNDQWFEDQNEVKKNVFIQENLTANSDDEQHDQSQNITSKGVSSKQSPRAPIIGGNNLNTKSGPTFQQTQSQGKFSQASQ